MKAGESVKLFDQNQNDEMNEQDVQDKKPEGSSPKKKPGNGMMKKILLVAGGAAVVCALGFGIAKGVSMMKGGKNEETVMNENGEEVTPHYGIPGYEYAQDWIMTEEVDGELVEKIVYTQIDQEGRQSGPAFDRLEDVPVPDWYKGEKFTGEGSGEQKQETGESGSEIETGENASINNADEPGADETDDTIDVSAEG